MWLRLLPRERCQDFQFFSIVSQLAFYLCCLNRHLLSIFLYCFSVSTIREKNTNTHPFNFSLLFQVVSRMVVLIDESNLSIFLYCFQCSRYKCQSQSKKTFNFSLLFHSLPATTKKFRSRNFQFFSIVSGADTTSNMVVTMTPFNFSLLFLNTRNADNTSEKMIRIRLSIFLYCFWKLQWK